MPKLTPPPSPVQNNSQEAKETINSMKFIKGYKKQIDKKIESSDAKIQEKRQELTGKLFNLMRENGCNPSDLNSISKFVQLLQSKSPELLSLFEKVFGILTGQGAGQAVSAELQPSAETMQGQEVPTVPEIPVKQV
jgi:uncharacterized protein YPO0396